MQIYGGRLDVVVSQAVLYIRDGISGIKHVHGPAVAEAMNGIDVLEPFRRERHIEVLFADSVDAMTSQFLPPLIYKEPVLI